MPVLFADADGRRDRRLSTAGARASWPGSSRPRSAAMRELGATTITAWVGPHVCGRCYEVPRGDAGRRGRGRAGQPGHHVVGHAVGRRRRRGPRPARARGRRGGRPVALHPRVAPTSSPTAATAPALRPPGRADPDGGRDERAATSSPPASTTYAAASPTPRRPPAATPDEVTPGRGHQVLPGLRRPPARRARRHRRRREPPPRGRRQARRVRATSACAGTSSAVCRATRRPRSASYADVVESVDRVKLVARPRPRRARARRTRSTCCSRSASTRPGATGRAGADPDDLRALADAVDGAGMLRLRGLMAVAPLGEDPARGVRAAGRRSAPAFVAEHPEATWLSAGHERRLRGRDRGRARHTCVSGPQSSVRVLRSSSVTTTTGATPSRGGGRSPATGGWIHERRDAQDRRVPRPARGHRRLRRRVRRAGLRRRPSSHQSPRRSCPRGPARSGRRHLATAPRPRRPAPAPAVVAELSRITTLHPRTYNEARTVGENFRDGVPVIMNLSEMDDADAKRLVDFAAGLVFATRGTIERVTPRCSCSRRRTSRWRPRRSSASSRAGSSTRADLRHPPRPAVTLARCLDHGPARRGRRRARSHRRGR